MLRQMNPRSKQSLAGDVSTGIRRRATLPIAVAIVGLGVGVGVGAIAKDSLTHDSAVKPAQAISVDNRELPSVPALRTIPYPPTLHGGRPQVNKSSTVVSSTKTTSTSSGNPSAIVPSTSSVPASPSPAPKQTARPHSESGGLHEESGGGA